MPSDTMHVSSIERYLSTKSNLQSNFANDLLGILDEIVYNMVFTKQKILI